MTLAEILTQTDKQNVVFLEQGQFIVAVGWLPCNHLGYQVLTFTGFHFVAEAENSDEIITNLADLSIQDKGWFTQEEFLLRHPGATVGYHTQDTFAGVDTTILN